MSVIAGDPHRNRAPCAKAQAAHRRGPRLLANRRLRRFRSGAVEKMTGDHPRRNTGPMLSSCLRRPAEESAAECMGVRRGQALCRQQERAEVWPLYARSHRGTPQLRALMRQSCMLIQDIEGSIEPPCRCLGREGRVRCAVVSIVARGLSSGRKRPRGPRRATDVG
jgi:hypothetical protein